MDTEYLTELARAVAIDRKTLAEHEARIKEQARLTLQEVYRALDSAFPEDSAIQDAIACLEDAIIELAEPGLEPLPRVPQAA